MLQKNVFPYYRACIKDMEDIYNDIKANFINVEQSVRELVTMRGYVLGGEQHQLLQEMQICSCHIDTYEAWGNKGRELGLYGSSSVGEFLLNDRYIIPVRDIAGGLIALIGYFPDYKKYITTPSPFFAKDTLFFNLDHAYPLSYKEFGGTVFVVEGIFDCLSLRAIGLPAIATMGSDVSPVKKEILKIFRKVVYIPDSDRVGRRALNRYEKRGWNVPDTATAIKLKGSVTFGSAENGETPVVKPIKDMDDLVSWFDADSVREALLESAKSKELVEVLQL